MGEHSSVEKGRIVEKLAALMHEDPGVVVETHVFLPRDAPRSKQREIDVLLTRDISGYPICVAIECKNEKKKIEVERIDAFVGKLEDVSIPRQQGIYVSASGYTKPAIARAKKAGIRPLVLQNITKKVLTEEVDHAFESRVYLLLSISEMSVAPVPANPNSDYEMLNFYNEAGEMCGTIMDLLWAHWRNGNISSELGLHSLEIEVPAYWYQKIDGKLIHVDSVLAKVQVTGLVITRTGDISEYTLTNAVSQAIERTLTNAEFTPMMTPLPVTAFTEETQIQDFMRKRKGKVSIMIGRIRLPRIRHSSIYWPPSKKALDKARQFAEDLQAGKLDQKPTIADIEGTDLSAIMEPIWEGYHYATMQAKGQEGRQEKEENK